MGNKKKKNSNYHYNVRATTDPSAKLKTNSKVTPIAVTVIIVAVIVSLIVGLIAYDAKIQGECVHARTRNVSQENAVYVEMEFEGYGKIELLLDRSVAPITVDNFVDLVESGFYNGLTIFRAQKDFVIQGGQNDKVQLDEIKGEFSSNGVKNDLSHIRGVISMARTNAPDSATSQFFITLDDDAARSLDGGYAAFGYVTKGLKTVDAIAEALYPYAVNNMGFVSDANAITISYAKVIK